LAQYERRWTQGTEGSIAGSLAAAVDQRCRLAGLQDCGANPAPFAPLQ
jgi:hypothetical protein